MTKIEIRFRCLELAQQRLFLPGIEYRTAESVVKYARELEQYVTNSEASARGVISPGP